MKAEKFAKSSESQKKLTFKKVFGKKFTVRDLSKEDQIEFYEQKLRNLERRLKALDTIQNNPEKYNERTLKKAYFESMGIHSKKYDVEKKLEKLKEE